MKGDDSMALPDFWRLRSLPEEFVAEALSIVLAEHIGPPLLDDKMTSQEAWIVIDEFTERLKHGSVVFDLD
jgi:hypothetical protein